MKLVRLPTAARPFGPAGGRGQHEYPFLGLWLPPAVGSLVQGFNPVYLWPYLVITTVIAVPAVWLLRRQSAHPGRPTPAS
jgi:hypothetical protein